MEAAIAKKMTYSAFRNMEIPDGDTSIYELINGQIVRRASPNSPHQILSEKLTRRLGNFVEEKNSGQILHAPLDVILDEKNVPQPDIFFVSKKRRHIVDPDNGVMGAPDLIIEIISPGTARYDRGDKEDLYERFGVKEYWIADPKYQSIEVYALKNDRYKLVGFATKEEKITSSVLKDLELDLSELFE